MMPDERQRLMKVETELSNLSDKVDSLEKKVDGIDSKLDDIVNAMNMGRGAWMVLRVGGSLMAVAIFVDWLWSKFHHAS